MAKSKNKKTITSGQNFEDVYLNDVGTSQLHQRHSVGIEKLGKMGRAVVLDQHIIDKLFVRKLLTSPQHSVADKYNSLICKSGAYGQSPSFERVSHTNNDTQRPLPRALILLNVQRIIVDSCGRTKENQFWLVMVRNPKRVTEEEVDAVSDCCDALLERWTVGFSLNPVVLFRQAVANPT